VKFLYVFTFANFTDSKRVYVHFTLGAAFFDPDSLNSVSDPGFAEFPVPDPDTGF
jgi:hypothetical protein